jgi:hypothetical protein
MFRSTRNAAFILSLIRLAANDLHSHIGFNFETRADGGVRIEVNGSLNLQTQPPRRIDDATAQSLTVMRQVAAAEPGAT